MSKLKAIGTIGLSNVGSNTKECRTLTYSVKGAETLLNVRKLVADMDKISGLDESIVDVMLKNLDTTDAEVNFSYKTRECQTEQEARSIKVKLDHFLKKKGGQTTLDEVEVG